VGDFSVTGSEIQRVVEEYSDMLFRIGITHLKSRQDAEDMVQNVLLKFMENKPVFENRDHEKAWLIRVAVNICRNHFKSALYRKTIPFDESRIGSVAYTMEIDEKAVMKAVLALPDKYRVIIYLFYFEGYSISQIAGVIKRKESTVGSQLFRARQLLKLSDKEEF
jgi:RNA polymerase sigma-70 factor (ECF subfamily)